MIGAEDGKETEIGVGGGEDRDIGASFLGGGLVVATGCCGGYGLESETGVGGSCLCPREGERLLLLDYALRYGLGVCWYSRG